MVYTIPTAQKSTYKIPVSASKVVANEISTLVKTPIKSVDMSIVKPVSNIIEEPLLSNSNKLVSYADANALFKKYGITTEQRNNIHISTDGITPSNVIKIIKDNTGKTVSPPVNKVSTTKIDSSVQVTEEKKYTIPSAPIVEKSSYVIPVTNAKKYTIPSAPIVEKSSYVIPVTNAKKYTIPSAPNIEKSSYVIPSTPSVNKLSTSSSLIPSVDKSSSVEKSSLPSIEKSSSLLNLPSIAVPSNDKSSSLLNLPSIAVPSNDKSSSLSTPSIKSSSSLENLPTISTLKIQSSTNSEGRILTELGPAPDVKPSGVIKEDILTELGPAPDVKPSGVIKEDIPIVPSVGLSGKNLYERGNYIGASKDENKMLASFQQAIAEYQKKNGWPEYVDNEDDAKNNQQCIQDAALAMNIWRKYLASDNDPTNDDWYENARLITAKDDWHAMIVISPNGAFAFPQKDHIFDPRYNTYAGTVRNYDNKEESELSIWSKFKTRPDSSEILSDYESVRSQKFVPNSESEEPRDANGKKLDMAYNEVDQIKINTGMLHKIDYISGASIVDGRPYYQSKTEPTIKYNENTYFTKLNSEDRMGLQKMNPDGTIATKNLPILIINSNKINDKEFSLYLAKELYDNNPTVSQISDIYQFLKTRSDKDGNIRSVELADLVKEFDTKFKIKSVDISSFDTSESKSVTAKELAFTIAKQLYGKDFSIPQMTNIYQQVKELADKDGNIDVSKLGDLNKELNSKLEIKEAGQFSVLPSEKYSLKNDKFLSQTFVPSVWDEKTKTWVEDKALAGNSIKTILSGSDTEIPKSYIRNENSELAKKIDKFVTNFYKDNKIPEPDAPYWQCVDYSKMMVDAAKKERLPAYIATSFGTVDGKSIGHAFVAFDLSGRMELLENYIPSLNDKFGMYAPQEFILYEPQNTLKGKSSIPNGFDDYNHIDIVKDPIYVTYNIDGASDLLAYNKNILRFRNLNYDEVTGDTLVMRFGDLDSNILDKANEEVTIDKNNLVGNPSKKLDENYKTLSIDPSKSSYTAKELAFSIAKQRYGDSYSISQMTDIYQQVKKFADKDGNIDVSKLSNLDKELGTKLKIQSVDQSNIKTWKYDKPSNSYVSMSLVHSPEDLPKTDPENGLPVYVSSAFKLLVNSGLSKKVGSYGEYPGVQGSADPTEYICQNYAIDAVNYLNSNGYDASLITLYGTLSGTGNRISHAIISINDKSRNYTYIIDPSSGLVSNVNGPTFSEELSKMFSDPKNYNPLFISRLPVLVVSESEKTMIDPQLSEVPINLAYGDPSTTLVGQIMVGPSGLYKVDHVEIVNNPKQVIFSNSVASVGDVDISQSDSSSSSVKSVKSAGLSDSNFFSSTGNKNVKEI